VRMRTAGGVVPGCSWTLGAEGGCARPRARSAPVCCRERELRRSRDGEVTRRARAARRQIFDDVWQQFTKLSGPIGSKRALDDALFRGLGAGNDEFETPQAAVTCVLVAGATGRCGPARMSRLSASHLTGCGSQASTGLSWRV